MNIEKYPEIMTLEEVAEYLRTTERTVANWATEGKIPAGKLGTSWRFKRQDIRKWVDDQLKNEFREEADTSLARIINRERVFLTDLSNKSAVLNLLIDSLADTPYVKDRDILAEAIYKREELMSTGIGQSVAVPHVRIDNVTNLAVAVALSREPVEDYESIDGKPVRLVVMIVARQDQHPDHLRTLSEISRRLKEPKLHQELLESETADELYKRLVG